MDDIERLEIFMQLREKGLISRRTILSAIDASEETLDQIDEEFLLDIAKAQMMDNLASKFEETEQIKPIKEESVINKDCSPFNFIILE